MITLRYATPQYFERFMKVSIETQIPMLIAGGHLTQAVIGNPQAAALLKPLVPSVWNSGLPVLATCAGLILLAERVENPDQRSYGLLPVTAVRSLRAT